MKGECYIMDNTSIPSNDDTRDIFNDVNMLLSSETSIMETELQSRHQYMKTGDFSFLMEGCSDIAEKMTESASNFSDAVSGFQRNVSKGISSISTEICNYVDKDNSIDKLDDFSFTFSGYKFKTTESKRINLSELDSVLRDYNKMIGELQSATVSEEKLSDFETKSRAYLEESNLSKVRAKMLGIRDNIYEYDFIDEVRRFYRGSISCVDITVNKKYIKSIPDQMKKLIKDRDITTEEMTTTMKMFSTMTNYIVGTLNDLNSEVGGQSCSIPGITLKSKGNVSSSKMLSVSRNDSDTIAKCITILRLTYSKVVKLQNMARIILSERLVAIKDQMQQMIDILNSLKLYIKEGQQKESVKEACGGSLSKQVGESSEENEEVSQIQPALDYTQLAMENMMISHPGYMGYLENRYLQESAFVQMCLESMKVEPEYFVMEASEASLRDRLVDFLNKIISFFRKKMIEYDKKYTEDIKKLYNSGKLPEKAKSYTEKLEILPYWKVTNVSQDKALIKNAMTKGATNKNKEDLSYMSSMVSVKTVEEWDDKKGLLRGYLLNYFRCHEKDAEQVKKIKVSGPEIASKLKIMVDYITGYSNIANGLDELRKAAETNMASLEKVQEAFGFLEIEQLPMEASDIALLEGFYALLEAETNNDGKKAGEAVGTDGEKTSPTSVEPAGDKNANNTTTTGDKKEEAKPTSNRYANIYERFFELAVTAYMTACEERYISYINILKSVNGGAFESKDGNKDEKKAATESVAYTESYFNKPSELKGTSLYK